ncbi:Translational activator gcn1 [Babesia sp. Xinjiang]|uniref:Translational activator gcn1 n=1 Tax=Babesia sp. Xinjiang TaxID=462227 RepID=UPI000A23F3E4|nr:Translational activator gcn1 [Babesia sp. Xinjiang]ORM40746.1 Translational activator gcn1 [Babesia sp. Xinjiang]
MDESCGPEPTFDCALRRIASGLLSRAVLSAVNRGVKRLRTTKDEDDQSSALAYDTLQAVANSFNKFMYQRILLTLVPALERFIKILVGNLKGLMQLHKGIWSVDKLLRCEGAGVFHLILLNHLDNRPEQLRVLKTSICDTKFVLSPVFARMISPLLGEITAEEFDAHISQDILRLIKRGHKGIVFTLFTLQKHMRNDAMNTACIDITDNIKNLLAQEDVSFFGADKLSPDDLKRNKSFSFIVNEVIHWFSNVAFRTADCRIAKSLAATVDSFNGTARITVSEQEINAYVMLLLIPDKVNEFMDVSLVSKFVEASRATLMKTAKSHPSESVQVKCVHIIGRLLHLIPDNDLETCLVDLVVNQVKAMEKVTPKCRDEKLNEKLLTSALHSLKSAIWVDIERDKRIPIARASELIGPLNTVIQFCHGKPVYKNCLIEAFCVRLLLGPWDNTASVVSSSPTAAGKVEHLSMQDVLETIPLHQQDPLAHLFLCAQALRNGPLNSKDEEIKRLMELDDIPSLVEAATEWKGSQLYGTMVDLYEEISKTKDRLIRPVLKCRYTKRYVEKQLESFTDAIEERHVYRMLLIILHSPNKGSFANSIRMLRDIWLSYNSVGRLFTVLMHCILFRYPLNGFENYSELAQMINSRSCKVTPLLKYLALDKRVVFGIVSHCISEGSVPKILEHYLAAQDGDVSSLLKTVLQDIRVAVAELNSFEKEDIEIYLAPPDKLFPDSRPYQPNLNQSDKKKHSNLTKQQLDDMRYKDQCSIRKHIASLVKKVVAGLYAISRAFAHKREYVTSFLSEVLTLCRESLRVNILYSPFSLLIDVFCPFCFMGSLRRVLMRVEEMLKDIYSKQTYSLDDDAVCEVLGEVNSSTDISQETSLVIAEITTYILLNTNASTRAKEASLQVTKTLLKSRMALDKHALIDALYANLKNETLYPAMRDALNEAVHYLVDLDGITKICKMGLLSNVELVKDAVQYYVSHHDLDALFSITEYVLLLGIDDARLSCEPRKIIDLVPIYIHENPELLHMAPRVLLKYVPDDVIDAFLASLEMADKDSRESLLRVLTCYFDISDGAIRHGYIFERLMLTKGIEFHLNALLACCKSLSKKVPSEQLSALTTHVRTWIEKHFLKGMGHTALGSLDSSKIVILCASAIFIGYLQEKVQYDDSVKWNLELLVAILSSVNEFSKAEVRSHSTVIVATLARKCALEGEEHMLNTMISNLLSMCSRTEVAIVPCISLLKGGGLSYLKKHDVITKLKGSLAAKSNPRDMLFVKELALQFERLLDPFVKDIFPNLVSCFNDTFDACLDACLSLVDVLTPVGFKTILPVIMESLGGYVSSIKLGCLLTLSHVMNNTKLHVVIIKNVCDVVKAVSPCTTDTRKPVKEAADGLLDSIVGLSGKTSILYPTMGSILKVLSHPSDTNITSTMHLLSDYSQKTLNDDDSSNSPIGVVELGLLEPILSRALRSRSGECRQSAIIFSSWLVSRCGGSREVEIFFTSLMPILTDLLKDSLPDIRREAANAIGSCANSFKKFGCDKSRALMVDLINCLTKCLMESATSLERRSAAAGLAQALCAVDDDFVHAIVVKLLKVLDYPDSTPQMREGCLALFTNLPLTRYDYVLSHLGVILSRVMSVLCDDDERVREMSSQVVRTVIEKYHDSAGDVVLDGLRLATASKDWQSRDLVLPLLQSLNGFREDPRVTVELYLARHDQNSTVKTTAMTIWKGVNVTRSLRQIFPLVLPRVIEMLEDDDDDIRTQAGECISDAVVRLGSGAVNDFIKAILNCEGAFRGRCIGIASLASNGKAGIEAHLTGILDFLKSCLCKPTSCHEASTALATLAGYFPTVVSDVLPSLVNDLFASGDKDTYLVGITLLIEHHSECFDVILREALKSDLDIIRLALLERLLCAKKAKVALSEPHVLRRCINQLVIYHRSYPIEAMDAFSSFVSLIKPESVMRLVHVLIEMLNDMAKIGKDENKSCLILFISRVIDLRESELDGNYGTLGDSLARYIFFDKGTLDASLVVFDQIIKSAERRTELDNLIGALSRYFSAITVADRTTDSSLIKSLPLMMSLVQKAFVRSNSKIEAAKCIVSIHKLVGSENMGPFVLKTIGAIIRCLNDKCPSILKVALLEAMHPLLHCEAVHVRVILYQLQSILFKCLTDANSDVNMLVGPNLRLYVKLAPNKSDSVMCELFKLALDKVVRPTLKTAALQAMIEVLKTQPPLGVSPFDKLLELIPECSGADRQLICQAIGLAAQLDNDFDTHWVHDLCVIIGEDPTIISAFSFIVSGIRGFTTLYEKATKEFIDVLRQSLKSEIPSLCLSALDVFSRISKLTRTFQLARDFVKSYINLLPSGAKLPPSGQSQLLKIYKRFLRFEKQIPNFGSQLLYLSEAIYGPPLVKLEAEKVLLVLLGPSRDLANLSAFVNRQSTSDKVIKLLSEYATRVLIRGNKVDQLSDVEM